MTDQNKSVSELESDIAKSRERLAATIDELAFRAQPKNIVEEQKRALRSTLMSKYRSFMGTTSADGYGIAHDEDASAVDIAKAKAEDLKLQAMVKADELKAQATAKAGDLKAQATAKVQDLTSSRSSSTSGQGFASTTTNADGTTTYVTEGAAGTDLKTRAQVAADQARLKLDEVTHDSDGELRTDRVATGLAVLGAALVAMGVAKRNGDED
ncbi:DUF3618 domain-containing protein [Arsenicicoccus dermatophilus]|uniref:DUF3618 domain-containing protein n=1 Tax=Arsenicicoccus dermatophilus TaxID=1076331 RepID=UPI001F4D240C|nr:DUF3618 domain-containing protein [Arsenicicoccus dermatophilus]